MPKTYFNAKEALSQGDKFKNTEEDIKIEEGWFLCVWPSYTKSEHEGKIQAFAKATQVPWIPPPTPMTLFIPDLFMFTVNLLTQTFVF